MPRAAKPSVPAVGWLDYVRLMVFGSGALLAGIACAGWLDGRKITPLPGVLSARSVTITAGRPSRLVEVLVHPGEMVEPGRPLLKLDDPRLTARIARQRHDLAALQAEVARAEAAAEVELTWRRRELKAEEFDTRMKLASLQCDRLNRQVEQIAWQEHLSDTADWAGTSVADSFLRPITLTKNSTEFERLQAVLKEDAASLAAESLTRQAQLCEQRLTELAAMQERLLASLRLSAGVEVAERRLAAAEAELAELLEQEAQLTVTSPGVGVIGLLLRKPGDLLAAGDPLLELIDDAERTVAVRIPSDSLHTFAQGQTVTIEFPDRVRREGVVGPTPPQALGDGAAPELPLQILPRGKLWPSVPVGTRVDVLPPR